MTADPRNGSARALVFLCALSGSWAFSFGLEAPLASLWLRDQGCSITAIGVNNAAYYLGILAAAAAVPALMRRWGRGCPLAGLIASGLTVAAFPFGQAPPVWLVVRFLNGAAGALALIPLESLINFNAPERRRARDFGCYAFAVVAGMALGEVAGWHLYGDWPRASFVLGGSVALLAAGLLPWVPSPYAGQTAPEGKFRPRRRQLLSFGSAWSSGFLEAGLMHMLPLHLVAFGLPEGGAGLLMAGILLGVIAFQVPIGWLADRFGRRRVLLGCSVIVAIGLGLVPWCASAAQLAALLFAVGACSGAFYPLGLAILGEQLAPAEIAAANAWYLGLNCLGSLISQPAAGLLMDHFGSSALFMAGQAAVLLVLAVNLGTWLLIGKQRRTENREPRIENESRAA